MRSGDPESIILFYEYVKDGILTVKQSSLANVLFHCMYVCIFLDFTSRLCYVPYTRSLYSFAVKLQNGLCISLMLLLYKSTKIALKSRLYDLLVRSKTISCYHVLGLLKLSCNPSLTYDFSVAKKIAMYCFTMRHICQQLT